MGLNIIEQLIITYTPLLATLISVVVSFVNMFRLLRNVIAENRKSLEVKDKNVEELKTYIQLLCNENRELRKKIEELIVDITRVQKWGAYDKCN